MTLLPRSSKPPSRRLASASQRSLYTSTPRRIVALFAISFISALGIVKLHNEASRNLDSHVQHGDNTHLPPTHNGQNVRKDDSDWDTSNSGKSKRGGLQVNISESLYNIFYTHVHSFLTLLLLFYDLSMNYPKTI
jgi:predicted PurR-regulated permease PerM